MPFGTFILETDVATLHASRQEHSIRVLHEINEFLARSLDDRIMRILRVAYPRVR